MSNRTDFRLPEGVDSDKVFLINLSQIEDRLDAEYYQLPLKKYTTIKLSNIATIKGGKRLPEGHSYIDEMEGYKYFRVAETKNNQVNIHELKNISETTYLALKSYELKNNDIIFSIAGTIGKTFLFQIDSDVKVILTENCAKITLKNSSDFNAKFLEILLNVSFIKHQVNKSFIQTTIPKLGLDRLGKILLPNVGNIKFQNEVVDFYEKNHKEIRALNVTAEQLLASINDYLLAELGITLPKVDNALENRMFYTQLSQLNGRLDPAYYFHNKTQIEGGIYPNQSLNTLVNLSKGNSITSENILMGNYPVIAGGKTSPYSHNAYNFTGETITVSASGAYSGYVWYHDYPIFASDCIVLTPKNSNNVLMQYIFEVLKLKQEEIYKLQTGAGQPHVYASDLAKIQIPLPSLQKQQVILHHINQRRTEAKTLQQEAKHLLDSTNQYIEHRILGATD